MDVLKRVAQFGNVCDSLPCVNCQLLTPKAKRHQQSLLSIPCYTYVTRRHLQTLRLTQKSDFLPGQICAHEADFDYTYVSCYGDSNIYCLANGISIEFVLHATNESHMHSAIVESTERINDLSSVPTQGKDQVNCLLRCGASLLVAGYNSGYLNLCDLKSRTTISSVDFGYPVKYLLHPVTYVNKILIVIGDAESDTLILWNLKTSTSVCRNRFHPSKGSRIDCIQLTSAIDVVAIGTSDGSIVFYNIKDSQLLFAINSFKQMNSLDDMDDTMLTVGVSAVAIYDLFSMAIVGHEDGTIHVFDLINHEHLYSENAYRGQGPVTSIIHVHTLAGGLCISLACNVLVHFVIEKRGALRKIREKRGLPELPQVVAFAPEPSNRLFTAGRNSLMVWTSACSPETGGLRNLFTTVLNACTYDEPIVDICLAPRVASALLCPEWTDLVIIHSNCRFVSLARIDGTKRIRNKATRQNKHLNPILTNHFSPTSLPPSLIASKSNPDYLRIPENSDALCCHISSCSSFCIVGYSSSHLVIFNLQSKAEKIRIFIQMKCSIRAVCFDKFNRYVIAGCDNGLVRVYTFKTQSPALSIGSINLDSGVSGQFNRHCNNNLFLVPLSNCSLSLLRVEVTGPHQSRLTETRRMNLPSDSIAITKTKLSEDGHFALVSTLNRNFAVFDLMTGSVVNLLKLDFPFVSFDLQDDILVGAYRGQQELTCFTFNPLNVPMDIGKSNGSTIDNLSDKKDTLMLSSFCDVERIAVNFRNLNKIDQILRNQQPEAAMNKPQAAPFFLPSVPTTSGFELVLQSTETDQTASDKMNSSLDNGFTLDKHSSLSYYEQTDFLHGLITGFTEHVHQEETEIIANKQVCIDVLAHLKKMNTVKIEFELDNLLRHFLMTQMNGSKGLPIILDCSASANCASDNLFECFLTILSNLVDSRTELDLCILILCRLAYKCSTESSLQAFDKYPELTRLSDLLDRALIAWKSLSSKVNSVMAVVKFLKSDPI